MIRLILSCSDATLDGTLSILSLDVHNKTVVHNVSVASTWDDPSADFVCYSTIARTLLILRLSSVRLNTMTLSSMILLPLPKRIRWYLSQRE